MPSRARIRLNASLADVDELIEAHAALTGGRVGRPAERQGEALTRADVVLLCAAMEVYFEDIFEETARLVYDRANDEEIKRLFETTSRRLNHPSIDNVTVMFFSVGMNHPFNRVRWRNVPNTDFKRKYNVFVDTRGRVAHGRKPTVRLSVLKAWKIMVENTATCFDRITTEHLEWMNRDQAR
jgi:hypothetical protein